VMPFVLLMPVITVSIGVLALGEALAWSTLAGGLVVLAGLALVVVRRAPAALPAA
jgi:drug/metabolite transporter (DMT)-like permease